MSDFKSVEKYLLDRSVMIASLTILSYGLLYQVFFKATNIALVCGGSSCLCLLTPLIYKVSRSFLWSVAYLLISCGSVIIYTGIYTGGIQSPVLFWVSLLPFIGVFLARAPWSSWKWFCLASLCIWLVWAHEFFFGQALSSVPADRVNFVQQFALYGLLLVSVILSHLFEARLSIQNKRSEDKSRELEAALEKLKLAQEISSSFGHLAIQIAHDIRAPVAALKSIAQDNPVYEEDERTIFINAINRIDEIATTLLVVNRNTFKEIPFKGLPMVVSTSTKIDHVIDEIVNEKRAQYSSKIDLRIVIEMSPSIREAVVQISSIVLKRNLSNIIDNCFEALPSGGVIKISGVVDEDQVRITVSDNGVGIPQNQLEKLGMLGGTYGKKEGSGLGLFHVRQSLEECGGYLRIESTPDVGTVVTLGFKKAVF